MTISNKQNFREAVAAAVRIAVRATDGTKSRRFNAIQKAVEEIKQSETMQFDVVSGCLSFVSRQSGSPRRVTRYGCSDLCECRNTISYHQAAFDILDHYIASAREKNAPSAAPAQAATVLQFPIKHTILSYTENGIETALCRNCGDTESISANAGNAAIKKHRNSAAARHQDCRDRTPHPQIAAHLARRVAQIEAKSGANGWIQDLLSDDTANHCEAA